MAKHLLYRFFGLRKLPDDVRKRLMQEAIVIDEEGTSCALGFKKFKGPRNASHLGWEGSHAGSLVITTKTLYVQLPYMLVCDQPIHSALPHVTLELKSNRELVTRFDAQHLFEHASGDLSCLWRTENAPFIYTHLQELQHEAPGT